MELLGPLWQRGRDGFRGSLSRTGMAGGVSTRWHCRRSPTAASRLFRYGDPETPHACPINCGSRGGRVCPNPRGNCVDKSEA